MVSHVPQELYLTYQGVNSIIDKDFLKKIMNYKGGINDIVYPNDHITIFNKAVFHCLIDSVKYLLEHGADTSIKSKYFDDPFYYSIDKYHLEVANILFKYNIVNKNNVDSILYIGNQIDSCYCDGYLELCNYLIKNCNRCFLSPYFNYHNIVYHVEHGAYISASYRKSLQKKAISWTHTNVSTDEYWLEYSDSEYSDSDSDTESEHEYVEVSINQLFIHKFRYIAQKLAKRRWTFIRCYVKLLGLHQRAVVSANHPNRLKQLGYFDVNEEISE